MVADGDTFSVDVEHAEFTTFFTIIRVTLLVLKFQAARIWDHHIREIERDNEVYVFEKSIKLRPGSRMCNEFLYEI